MVVISNNEGRGLGPFLQVPLVWDGKSLMGIAEIAKSIQNADQLLFCGKGYGAEAEALATSNDVYGASLYADSINDNIGNRMELATELGMSIPEYKRFSTPEERDIYIVENEHWEPLSARYAIRKNRGVPITAEAFYEDGKFKNIFCKIQGDRLLYNNNGAYTPSSVTTTFSQPNVIIKKLFYKLADIISIKDRTFKGPVTISTVSTDDQHWYRNIHFGYDVDHEYGKIALCGGRIVLGEGDVCKGFATTVRLYDVLKQGLFLDKVSEIDRKYIVPVDCTMENGRLKSCGLVPLVCIGLGSTIKKSFENCYAIVRSTGIRDLCYRPDGEAYAFDWWRRAKRVGAI
jgi:hypothetical protein